MAKINYKKIAKQARQVIKDAGAAFTIEREGKKRRGYFVMDSSEETNRDESLIDTEQASGISSIEILAGDVIYFEAIRVKYRVLSATPEKPNGIPIVWNCAISR